MDQHYTQRALRSLDDQIVKAEERLSEAMLGMGSGADADNNTWHDNPAFEQAKMDVDQARNELSRLRKLRKDAQVVEVTNSGVVEVGSTVVIKFADDDEPMRVSIGGHYVVRKPGEETEAMEVSTSSPLGAALLNRKPGEMATYLSPSGSRMEVSILELV